MKKIFIFIALLSSLYANNKDKIVVAGPIATVSHPIFYMIENDVLKDLGKKIEFKLWNNPDELRALVINNSVDFIALPTNVAANLYNKNIDLKLLNVSIWGILQLISREDGLKTIDDFKGKKIVVPFRNDMPDIVLKALIKKAGYDYKKDFNLQYVATPVDAMQMLILRRYDHALLAEPAVSIALKKTNSYPVKLVASDLYRSVNLQDEWGRLFGKNKVPQAGLAFLGDTKNSEVLISRFLAEYEKALNYYKENPSQSAKLVVKNLPMLEEDGLALSISNIIFENKSAEDSKKELEEFFEILMQNEPKLIGSKLPNETFYYK